MKDLKAKVEKLIEMEKVCDRWCPTSTSDISSSGGRLIFYGTHDAIGEHRDLVISLRNSTSILPLLVKLLDEVEAGRDKNLDSEHRYVGLCPHCVAASRLVAARQSTDAANAAAKVVV